MAHQCIKKKQRLVVVEWHVAATVEHSCLRQVQRLGRGRERTVQFWPEDLGKLTFRSRPNLISAWTAVMFLGGKRAQLHQEAEEVGLTVFLDDLAILKVINVQRLDVDRLLS